MQCKMCCVQHYMMSIISKHLSHIISSPLRQGNICAVGMYVVPAGTIMYPAVTLIVPSSVQ